MTIRLFISRPMRNKTDEEILEEREHAIKRVRELLGDVEADVEVIDPFSKNAPTDTSSLWFLGKSLELLSTADVIYFCNGWDTARCCRIEQMCAVEYGISRIYADCNDKNN